MELVFNINNQVLTRGDKQLVVANSRNYVSARFNFSDDWIGKIITVTFIRNGEQYPVLLDETCSCMLPNEILKKTGGFRVVISGMADGVTITTNYLTVEVHTGNNEFALVGAGESISLYEQILNRISEIQLGQINEETIRQHVKQYLEKNPIEVDLENLDVRQLVNDYILQHTDDLKGADGVGIEQIYFDLEHLNVKLSNGQKITSPSLKGNDGVPGRDGKDGYSPVRGVDYYTDEDRAGIREQVSQDVSDYFAIHKDELKGEAGAAGSNGKTPVKGEDYWTAEDIADIKAAATDYLAAHKEDFKGSKGNTGAKGKDGYSPVRGVDYYTEEDQNAIHQQLADDIADYIETHKDELKGKDGQSIKGDTGLSAYEIAVDNGFQGTETEWLESLKGEDGIAGKDGAAGESGRTGSSAYDIAVEEGFVGTRREWLDSLRGKSPDVEQAVEEYMTVHRSEMTGAPGLSAYELAILHGFLGTEEEWLESLKGEKGDKGGDGSVVAVTPTLLSGTKIAEIDVNGTTTNLFAPSKGGGTTSEFIGTKDEWNALTTEQQNAYDIVYITDDGKTYKIVVPSGGLTGQVLAKKSDRDYDLEWVNEKSGGNGSVSNDTDFIYVAHRGLYGSTENNIPENTIEAYINALNDGFKWLEIDIRRSSDGVWVMAHDARLNVYDSQGIATNIAVNEKTVDELQAYTYDVDGLYHISILADVLCKLKRYDTKCIIDNKIKSPNYEEELFNIINACGMTHNAILSVNVDWGLKNIDILNANKKTPIRIWVDDYAKAKTLIDSINNDVYLDMNVSYAAGRNECLPLVMALNRPIITAGLSSWDSAQNKHAINVIAGGMMESPVTYEQMKNRLNIKINYSDITITGADPCIDVATRHQITAANNNSGSGYINIYTDNPLIASTVIDTNGTTSQATITAQSKGVTNAFVMNGSVCRAIKVQSAPNGFWQASDVTDSGHKLTNQGIKAILLEFTHESAEKIVVESSTYSVMHRYNLDWFKSYNIKLPTIPNGATKFYSSFSNDVQAQFYIKFFTEDFVSILDSQGWQSTKEKDIPSNAKYICITMRYANQASLMADNGNDPAARARFQALIDAVSYRFEIETTLSSISATKTNTEYAIGDVLDISDIVVIANYSDGTHEDVTSSATIDTSDVDMSVQGVYTIAISYTQGGITETTSIPILVGPAVADYSLLYGRSIARNGSTIASWTDNKRMTALTQIPNGFAIKDVNTTENLGYLIPVPTTATNVTVTVPSGYLAGIRIVTPDLRTDLNPGWSSSNVVTYSFPAGQSLYLAVNVKNSTNTEIPSTVNTSSWTIEFT